MNNEEIDKLKKLLSGATTVVIIQADNPDGDSLASALALEEILGDLNKQTHLYCGVDMPDYLKHLKGWDRVNKEIPTAFDLSVIVDTSANDLLTKLNESPARSWVASKPVIVLDHHSGVKCDISYASLVINDDEAVSTGEVIYKIATALKWPLNLQAKTHILSSILSDSLGLSSDGTTPTTYRIVADLVESGVNRSELEEARKALNKMPVSIYSYKADLIKRTEFMVGGKVAFVSIPHDEVMEYSPLYNPGPLIHGDMLQVENVLVAIVVKVYKDGRITGSIRTSAKAPVAAEIAQKFGGGGHVYASGFKITDGTKLTEVKEAVNSLAKELLNGVEQ